MSKKHLLLCGAIFPLLAVFSGSAFAGPQMEGESVHRATRGSRSDTEVSGRSIRAMPPPSARHRLRGLSDDERRPVSRKPGLDPVGIARAIPGETMATGEWSLSPEGTAIWRLALESPEAEAVRLYFADFHVGAGKVWLMAAGSSQPLGPYTGDGPSGDGEFWSDIVEGSTVTVAWEPDTGTRADAIPFRIPELSHRFRAAVPKSAPAADGTDVRSAGAASCAVDATCYSEYSEPASAVALMIFESGGESYDCTGSMISSAAKPAVPYFLTANHCISTAAEAKSLIAVFNYQTATCNGEPPRLRDMPRVNGATYISGGPMAEGDFTLLQLSRFPDVDVKLLGWSADPIADDEQVIGISHPRGDYRRISLGRRTRDLTIRFSDGDRMPARVGYQVAWYQGVTQGGSSGSPLLATSNGKQYVVGTLSAGPDVDENDSAQVCRTRNLTGSYGRFSVAYPTLAPWLSGDAPPAQPPAPAAAQAPALTGSLLNVTQAGGQTLARISLSWNAPGIPALQIRVGSPSGPAMTGIEGSSGSAETGDWVTDGMIFYLQDATSGDSAGRAKTISAIQVTLNVRRP